MSAPSHTAMFRCLVWRDVMLAWRRPADALSTVIFFGIAASLFPLSTNPEPQLLRAIAPCVVWVVALLASMLSLERLFAHDYADGTLEQMLLTPQPLYLIVLGKLVAHWLVSGIPLILIAPILGCLFGLAKDVLWMLMASLLLGVPVLSLVGAIGAALTLGLRGGGVLISLLVLPLCIPALVFGAAGDLDLIGALLVLTLVFAPLATSSALRISLE